MDRHARLIAELAERGEGSMRCVGNSMRPTLANPCINTYRRQDAYAPGDIVFCRVKGRYIDAHFVIAAEGDRYLIANGHGHQNGWTRTVYGRVVRSVDMSGRQKSF